MPGQRQRRWSGIVPQLASFFIARDDRDAITFGFVGDAMQSGGGGVIKVDRLYRNQVELTL